MLASTDSDIAYVIDDGLTSFSGHNVEQKIAGGDVPTGVGMGNTSGDYMYLTFIGTGISNKNGSYGTGWTTIAQNLPYGTHVLKIVRDADSDPDYTIDGVAIDDVDNDSYGVFTEVSFHQPKMPPIPEDAVVIADYMLMADHVVQTDADDSQISKGVRFCSGSRDTFVDVTGGSLLTNTYIAMGGLGGLKAFDSPNSGGHTATAKLPFFGTNAQSHVSGSHGPFTLALGGVGKTEIDLDNSTGSEGDIITIADSEKVTLGQTDITTTVPTGGYGWYGYSVATPIHTSSHYKFFETPLLHELVGGDRNMEQNNLNVTPDGKTWDEVTRDVSYIGNTVLSAVCETDSWVYNDQYWVFEEMRGKWTGATDSFNKDFAIAYDRHICLRDGFYTFSMYTLRRQSTGHMYIRVNGSNVGGMHQSTGDTYGLVSTTNMMQMKRGDYIQVYDEGHGGMWSHFYIQKQNRN
jgi:hypothetical protein